MPRDLRRYLAGRFADDARALRERASALEGGSKTGTERRRSAAPAGPDAALCRRMAEACDRISALFTGARSDDPEAIRALIPALERYKNEEREPSVQHVYAGAIIRVRENVSKSG